MRFRACASSDSAVRADGRNSNSNSNSNRENGNSIFRSSPEDGSFPDHLHHHHHRPPPQSSLSNSRRTGKKKRPRFDSLRRLNCRSQTHLILDHDSVNSVLPSTGVATSESSSANSHRSSSGGPSYASPSAASHHYWSDEQELGSDGWLAHPLGLAEDGNVLLQEHSLLDYKCAAEDRLSTVEEGTEASTQGSTASIGSHRSQHSLRSQTRATTPLQKLLEKNSPSRQRNVATTTGHIDPLALHDDDEEEEDNHQFHDSEQYSVHDHFSLTDQYNANDQYSVNEQYNANGQYDGNEQYNTNEQHSNSERYKRSNEQYSEQNGVNDFTNLNDGSVDFRAEYDHDADGWFGNSNASSPWPEHDSPQRSIPALSASASDTPSFLHEISNMMASSDDWQFCDDERSEDEEIRAFSNSGTHLSNEQQQQQSRQPPPLETDKGIDAAEANMRFLALATPPPPPPGPPPQPMHDGALVEHAPSNCSTVVTPDRSQRQHPEQIEKTQDQEQQEVEHGSLLLQPPSTDTTSTTATTLSPHNASQISGYEQDVEDFVADQNPKARLKRNGTAQRPSRGNSPVERYTRSDASSSVVMAARDFLAYMERTKKEEALREACPKLLLPPSVSPQIPPPSSNRKGMPPSNNNNPNSTDEEVSFDLAHPPQSDAADSTSSSSCSSDDQDWHASRLYQHLLKNTTVNPSTQQTTPSRSSSESNSIGRKKTIAQHLEERSLTSGIETDEESPLQGIGIAPSSSSISLVDPSLETSSFTRPSDSADEGMARALDKLNYQDAGHSGNQEQRASASPSPTSPGKSPGRLQGLISMFESRSTDTSRANGSFHSNSFSTSTTGKPSQRRLPESGASVASSAASSLPFCLHRDDDDDNDSQNLLNLSVDNRLSPASCLLEQQQQQQQQQRRQHAVTFRPSRYRSSPDSPSGNITRKQQQLTPSNNGRNGKGFFWRSQPQEDEAVLRNGVASEQEECFIPIKQGPKNGGNTQSPRDSRYPGWYSRTSLQQGVTHIPRKDQGLPPFAPPVYQNSESGHDAEEVSDFDESWDRFSMYSSTDIQGFRVPGADEI